MNYERPELLDKLAGSYVLGTMSAGARRRFARLLKESASAQRAVASWNNQLSPLYEAVPQLQPPPRLWQSIAARTTPQAAARPAGWRERLGLTWRSAIQAALAYGMGVVFMGSLAKHDPSVLGLHRAPVVTPPSYVGLLTDADGNAALTVGSLRRGKMLTLKVLRPLSIPAGMVARLWALPADRASVPVTNLPANGRASVQLAVPAENLFAAVPKLAVSFELDPNASKPTSPFVLSGHCVKFW